MDSSGILRGDDERRAHTPETVYQNNLEAIADGISGLHPRLAIPIRDGVKATGRHHDDALCR